MIVRRLYRAREAGQQCTRPYIVSNGCRSGFSGDDLLISGSVANELSSWTSAPNTTTFDAGLYARATDNDAALTLLLMQWSSTGNRSSLAAILDDGVLVSVWGDSGIDHFSTTPGEAQDFNATGMGTDEMF